MKNFVTLTLTVLFCTVLASFSLMGQCINNDPTDKGIVPTTVLGDNTPRDACLKFDPPVDGVLNLDSYGNKITISKSTGSCGEVLSWSVPDNIVVDAIYAKGSNGYNIYDYSGTGYTSDGGLHCPVNASGGYAEFSHYNICFHYKLDVSKSATTSYTRQYDWDITKECLGASSINLAVGATTSYPFKWTATNTGYADSQIKVTGTISIANNTPFSATITSVVDELSDGTGASVSGCPTPFTLAPGTSKDCSYEASPGDLDAGVNTVTVSTNNANNVSGDDATANYAFGSPTTEIDKCITVTDNCQAGSNTVCVSQSPYSKSYNCTIGPYLCSASETYTNSVSFRANTTGTFGSASCDVAVTTPKCKLTVSKTANTSYTKTYLWDIDKNCLDGSELTLSDGQIFNYNFNWIAKLTGQPLSDIKVSGVISIANNSHLPATVSSITDQLSSGSVATVSGCPVPFDLGPGESVNCSYEALPAGITSGTNNVTVVTSTPNVLGNTASKAYTFGSPTTEVDKSISVTDNCVAGSLTVWASQAPYTKSYACAIGPYSCGTDETYTNTVSFVTSNTAQTGSAECSVSVTVPECGTGCTLTQGYWKTHSIKGPAKKADPAWDLVGGPNATFYSSGKTWYQVFWTPPAGNAYYNLAHQFMAARLNVLSGASTTAEVDASLAYAQTFFSTYTPSSKLSSTVRNLALKNAGTLDNYNNGAIGPGHCDEDGTSSSIVVANSPYRIDARPDQQKLQLTPNPARSEVQINLSSFIGMNVEIQLTDRLGRTVLVQKLGNLEISTYNLQLNALSIPSGIYQVTVRSNELLLTEPLVIQSDK